MRSGSSPRILPVSSVNTKGVKLASVPTTTSCPPRSPGVAVAVPSAVGFPEAVVPSAAGRLAEPAVQAVQAARAAARVKALRALLKPRFKGMLFRG